MLQPLRAGLGRGSARQHTDALTWNPGWKSARRWGKWPQTQTEMEKAARAPRRRLSHPRPPVARLSNISPIPAAGCTQPLRR